MSDDVKEWIAKAEADLETAEHDFATAPRPNFDVVCFLAQQCAEKMVKALLVARGIRFPRTHDIADLVRLAAPPEPSLQDMQADLSDLSTYAVAVRYPGVSADKVTAEHALQIARQARHVALVLLTRA